MSRLQLSLNVNDLDAAIAFYSKVLNANPAKVRPGYANFAVEDPPLKLVLNSPNGPGGTINHLGVEVETSDAVQSANARLTAAGITPTPQPNALCCYARQDKVWVHDPDRVPWEVYTVLEDTETA